MMGRCQMRMKFDGAEEPVGKCEYCKQLHELRPYGRDGVLICFQCAHKKEHVEETKFQLVRKIYGQTIH